MLRKAMKHEFRATSRVMLPLFIALLLLSIVTHFSSLLLNGSNVHWVLSLFAGLMLLLFFVSLIAIVAGVIALSVKRFAGSFFSDEGYLTMTLPVSTHTLLLSRLIVSVIWYVLTTIAVALAVVLLVMDGAAWSHTFQGFGPFLQELWQALGRLDAGELWSGILLVVELLLGALLAGANASLVIYAAVAVGNSFQKAKKGLSVLFVFVFYHGEQMLWLFFAAAFLSGSWFVWNSNIVPSIGMFNGMLGVCLLGEALMCTGFYFLTHYFVSKKLNLE